MTDATRKALEYIERTARALLDEEHPKPRRAAYLLVQNALMVEGASTFEFPEDGWP